MRRNAIRTYDGQRGGLEDLAVVDAGDEAVGDDPVAKVAGLDGGDDGGGDTAFGGVEDHAPERGVLVDQVAELQHGGEGGGRNQVGVGGEQLEEPDVIEGLQKEFEFGGVPGEPGGNDSFLLAGLVVPFVAVEVAIFEPFTHLGAFTR